ncbi:MAG: hypothetical protein HKN12_01595 [Gemmatimonadetes bacterium]|nr:hypothetical protein [Gemmatimonadota bacterium]
MLSSNLSRVLRLALILSVFSAIGCGDAPAPTGPSGSNGTASEGSELTGSWSVTRFAADSVDAITAGSSMVLTFTEGGSSPAGSFARGVQGTFTLTVANDYLELCEEAGPDCAVTGTYRVTDGTLFFNPDTEDELAWTYSVAGGILTLNGVIDGIDIEVFGARG